MSSNLAERLNVERRRQFVGRTAELNLFRSTLMDTERRFCLLHIFGSGGIGKTTLLRELIYLCEQLQITATYLDARSIEPTPESFLAAFTHALGSESGNPIQILESQLDRQVVLIDTYETLAPLDPWLHETFLPQLSANTLIVLASRQPPASSWRADPGWQALIHPLPLRNLNLEEGRAYLSKRDIPAAQHQAVLDFTYGHPLALSLVADVFAQKQNFYFQPDAAPDIVKTLLEKFVQELPSPAHRMALEASALVRLTTEALLAKMLEMDDVYPLFEWLRSLSFIESGILGIFPHDLIREVLIADIRWRNPDRYIELHSRARSYYTTRLGQTQGQEQHRILFDYIFLHRDNAAVRPRFTWQETSSLKTDSLREADRPFLISMVRKHEGAASAQLAEYWLARQPQGVLVFREAVQPVGFVLMVTLHQASPEELQVDPGAAAAWAYLSNHAPLRAGEGATFFRFWMADDTYQAVSPIQSRIFIAFVQHHRNTPGLAYTFFACAEPESWAAMFAYADLARIAEADFAVGDRLYGVYGHDWRVTPPEVWQELLAQREIAASAQAALPPQSPEPLVVLSYSDFVSAVREALGQLAQPDRLKQSPLLRSRLVVDRVSAKADKTERVAALQVLLQAVIESLQSSPRDAKCYRALYHSYLQPALTQEKASELLDVPLSTFRRHLKTGVSRVIDILWHQEIGRSEK
ncbi:ATP-binding protein [Phormidium tenue FACHB-886]|nr:ATP-binding protein [Phormidium tenue FACHB-886]